MNEMQSNYTQIASKNMPQRSMELARRFMGSLPRAQAQPVGVGAPLPRAQAQPVVGGAPGRLRGLNFENMGDFAQTPAGRALLAKMQQRG